MRSVTISPKASREDIENYLRDLFDEHGHDIAHDGWLGFVSEDSFATLDLPDLLLDIDEACDWVVPESEMVKFSGFDFLAKWVDYFFANREKFRSEPERGEAPSTSSGLALSTGSGEQTDGCF